MSGAKVSAVSEGSPAYVAGIREGDAIISINGVAPTDIIEYQQLIDGASVEVIATRDSDIGRKFLISKMEGEPLGISIESAIFDRIRTCDNHCNFCFIYQLPKGMRRSLYVKDDDYRLSFLYGNFTTLTRFTEMDLERVLTERLSPLFVSIHATDPEVRSGLLRNRRGATSLRWLQALLDAGITVHAQIVACPGFNIGEELRRTMFDMLTMYSSVESVAVVPFGVSTFSTESEMRPYSRDEARETLADIATFDRMAIELVGRSVFFASDEMYLIAEMEPPADTHQSVDLAENGVGLISAFTESFLHGTAMDTLGTGFFQSVDGAPAWGYRAPRFSQDQLSRGDERVTILTGEYAASRLRHLLAAIGRHDIDVMSVENRFFGGNIKVAGLLTGVDIARSMEEIGLDRYFVIPDVCLSENRFLDGLTLEDLPAPCGVVETTGIALRQFVDSVPQKANAS